MLRAKKAELVQAGKPKFLISGKSGVGKTFFSLDFPSIYFIDTEGGATREQYRQKLIQNGGVYLGKEEGSQDYKIVIDELKTLATTKHSYKTLIIDSFSSLYLLTAAKAEEKIGSDYGKDKKEANKPTRQLLRWLEDIDMTVVLICHSKDKWSRRGQDVVYEGTTFDGYDKMEYVLDLWIEVIKEKKSRFFVVKKSRIDNFIEGEVHTLDFSKFAELYGKDIIEKEAKPIPLASADSVERITKLAELLNVDKETIEEWFEKAGVDKWEDMKQEYIDKCIAFLDKKLVALNPKKEEKK